MTAAAWLTVRGVAKSYGGVHALRSVDLDLLPNLVYGFIGPNGAGKSTLMKVLTGAVGPDAGEVRLDGEEIELGSPPVALARGLVMMPQELTLVPSFTATENVLLGSEPRHGPLLRAGAGRAEARKALDVVGLDVDGDRVAAGLSPVEQRLLMLAKAVARDTRLLVLDEPTAGLPPVEARQVTETVVRLRDHGLTVCYVSHHLSEVAALCDEVLCIREGQVAAHLRGGEVTKEALVDAMVGPEPAVNETSSAATGADPADGELVFDRVTGQRITDVSFTARRGEVTGVTGLLGSGVSELVAVLSGAARPVSGRVLLDGVEITPRSPADALRAGVGMVTGNRAESAMLSRSIRDNVSVTALRTWFGRLGLIREAKERRLVAENLAALGVRGDAERPLTALSGGNQQRVLVSRLLAADLTVLVFDNPTVGVDIASRAQLWHELRALARDRIVVLASSEADELMGVCDRVVCLHDGQVTEVLGPGAITERALTRATA